MEPREQACWLLLVFEGGLTNRVVNTILATWCKQLGRSLQDFFEADIQEWYKIPQLKPESIQKLEQAKEKRLAQGFLVEQLQEAQIRMVTVLDPEYPALLKSALDRTHLPSVLFVMGDLHLLERRTIAIIGSRNASAASLDFTKTTAQTLAQQGANVISGNARGVDRAAYEGATSVSEGHTTVVLPHGIRKLSKAQMRDLLPRIEAGNVLLMSQFHPDAQWVVSRAMERNNVVTSLAQIVIVAESDIKGGTWEGATKALDQKRRVYIRQDDNLSLPGNAMLIQKGGMPILWPTEHIEDTVTPLLKEGSKIQKKQQKKPIPAEQQSLFAS
ncbi:MAG: hypothetical protein NVS9B9_17900 [Ktedonobacteraceae bacterium]